MQYDSTYELSVTLRQAAVGQLSDLSAGGAEIWCRLSKEPNSRAEEGLRIWDSVMRLIQERAKCEPANEITIQDCLTSESLTSASFSLLLHDLTDNHHMA